MSKTSESFSSNNSAEPSLKLNKSPRLQSSSSSSGSFKPVKRFTTIQSFNSNHSAGNSLSTISSKNTNKSKESEKNESESQESQEEAESEESEEESQEEAESQKSEEESQEEDESEESEKESQKSEEESQEGEEKSNESEEESQEENESEESEESDESEEENQENLPRRHVNRLLKQDKKFKEKTTNIWKTEFREGRHKCIHKMYLTKVWAKFFKKGTTSVIRFGTDNIKQNPIPEKECNYFLLNIILKDYENSNRNYDKRDIDAMIISGYRKYFKEETKKIILKKWIKEKSDDVMDVYHATNKLRKLETYIQTTEYFITLIDIIMFMATSKIPILLLYQSKKTQTSDGIKLFYMKESDYYYIIKLRNNRIFMLHMWSIAKNMRNNVTQIKFSKDNMTRDLINKLTRVSTVDDYFKSSL